MKGLGATMEKIICTMCFAAQASIVAALLLGAEATSITYPTVWMAGATLILAITTLLGMPIGFRQKG